MANYEQMIEQIPILKRWMPERLAFLNANVSSMIIDALWDEYKKSWSYKQAHAVEYLINNGWTCDYSAPALQRWRDPINKASWCAEKDAVELQCARDAQKG